MPDQHDRMVTNDASPGRALSEGLALVLIVALHAFGACTPMHAGARDAVASHGKAKELWQQNMTVVDESVEFWKKQTGTAQYTPKELENAIDFFETVTELRGRANMSFIGIIPDESLENASREWKTWYDAHGERLTYDASKKRVIFRPVHIRHLVEWRPEIAEFLALPPGWRFLVAGVHEDVWCDDLLLSV